VDVSDEEEVEKKEKPGITLQGILELVALGAGLSHGTCLKCVSLLLPPKKLKRTNENDSGAPNLGKFTGVDKKTGTLNFELEKNTFTSKITGKTQNSFDNRCEYVNIWHHKNRKLSQANLRYSCACVSGMENISMRGMSMRMLMSWAKL
jgi:hypothetical protein